jgi:hypothetical protein
LEKVKGWLETALYSGDLTARDTVGVVSRYQSIMEEIEGVAFSQSEEGQLKDKLADTVSENKSLARQLLSAEKDYDNERTKKELALFQIDSLRTELEAVRSELELLRTVGSGNTPLDEFNKKRAEKMGVVS